MSRNEHTHKKSVERGLSIYKTGRSRFWFARFYDRRQKKYVVKSTGETNRLEATTVAREWKDSYLQAANVHIAKANTDDSFEFYARMIPKSDKDDWVLLNREKDGILAELGDYNVTHISTAIMRSYLNTVNGNRPQPLAISTQKKHIITIRKALRYARENGKITTIPESPKLAKQVENPRPSFADHEYRAVLQHIRTMDDENVKIKGMPVDREYYDFIVWIVHTFVRPTVNELFNTKVSDCKIVDDPSHVELTVHGKTGFRVSASMPAAVDLLERQVDRHQLKKSDFLWFPQYENRSWAMRKAGVVFNEILDQTSLRFTEDGQKRSLYSLRHYALGLRLRASGGKVNIFNLARNAGTSVAMC